MNTSAPICIKNHVDSESTRREREKEKEKEKDRDMEKENDHERDNDRLSKNKKPTIKEKDKKEISNKYSDLNRILSESKNRVNSQHSALLNHTNDAKKIVHHAHTHTHGGIPNGLNVNNVNINLSDKLNASFKIKSYKKDSSSYTNQITPNKNSAAKPTSSALGLKWRRGTANSANPPKSKVNQQKEIKRNIYLFI
jgi:hypothetical protein